MADVRPFRGLRYNGAVVSDLAAVTCPPYDVIAAAAQQRYYERHPLNVIRLEQGVEYADDTLRDNKYSRAATHLQAWLEEGVLVPEARPALYLYDQEFTHGERRYRRRLLFAAVRLEDWDRRVVLPHERTMPKPKADRLDLMRACAANVSPILALYEDEGNGLAALLETATQERPAVSFADEAGEEHRLWVLVDDAAIAAVVGRLAHGPIYIADGHHRYETALAYRDERRALEPGYSAEEPYNFVLMALASADDPGLVVLPTHRLVAGPPRLGPAELMARLSAYFAPTRLHLADADPAARIQQTLAAQAESHVFGLYVGEEDAFYRLALRDEAAVRALMPPERSPAWKGLDVSVLHTALIEDVLDHHGEEPALAYTRDEQQALHSVRAGEHWLALFVRPTRVAQVQEVALAGDRMPEKSTYFYPKVLTGLVMHRL